MIPNDPKKAKMAAIPGGKSRALSQRAISYALKEDRNRKCSMRTIAPNEVDQYPITPSGRMFTGSKGYGWTELRTKNIDQCAIELLGANDSQGYESGLKF